MPFVSFGVRNICVGPKFRVENHTKLEAKEKSMGILTSLLVRAPVESFAKTLAQDIAKRYPAALDQQVGKRPSINRLTRIVEDAVQRAVEFHHEQKLGWLGKAALGNSFRWELTELGYQKDFVDFATEAVVVTLSKTPKLGAPE